MVIFPDLSIPCACGQHSWAYPTELEVLSDAAIVEALVILPAAVTTTKFATARCGGCGQERQADGYEEALLRKTEQVVFALEVMYQWALKMAAGGVPWWTFWRDLLQKVQDKPLEWKKNIMTRQRKTFQYATLDFITLQRINYRASFCCPTGGKSIINDAITVGPKRGQCCVFKLPPQATIKAGSTFKQRVMIRGASTRKALAAFASKGKLHAPLQACMQLACMFSCIGTFVVVRSCFQHDGDCMSLALQTCCCCCCCTCSCCYVHMHAATCMLVHPALPYATCSPNMQHAWHCPKCVATLQG